MYLLTHLWANLWHYGYLRTPPGEIAVSFLAFVAAKFPLRINVTMVTATTS